MGKIIILKLFLQMLGTVEAWGVTYGLVSTVALHYSSHFLQIKENL
jgi:hypothetical protein